MAGSRPAGESGAPIEETQHLLENDTEPEVSGLEGLMQISPDSSAPGESLLVNERASSERPINDVPANLPFTLSTESTEDAGESNENVALLQEPLGPQYKKEEANLSNPITEEADNHVGGETTSCGNLMLVKPEIHEDFRDQTGSGAEGLDGPSERAIAGPPMVEDSPLGTIGVLAKSKNGPIDSLMNLDEAENEVGEEEEEDEEQTANTKPLLENDAIPLTESNAALCDGVAMDTTQSPSSPSVDLDEVFVADEHMKSDATLAAGSATMENHASKLRISNRNQLKPLPIVKDHLTVKMNVGPKLSDASTDELSDVEEELEYRGRPWYKQCRKSRACCISLYFWVVLLFLGSIAAMVTVGILVVDNYRRAELFEETFCRGYDSHNVGERIKCSCGKGCTSDYRCIDVSVQYTDLKGNAHKFGLRDNEAMIGRQVSDNNSLYGKQ